MFSTSRYCTQVRVRPSRCPCHVPEICVTTEFRSFVQICIRDNPGKISTIVTLNGFFDRGFTLYDPTFTLLYLLDLNTRCLILRVYRVLSINSSFLFIKCSFYLLLPEEWTDRVRTRNNSGSTLRLRDNFRSAWGGPSSWNVRREECIGGDHRE